jgi:hypothetical protein
MVTGKLEQPQAVAVVLVERSFTRNPTSTCSGCICVAKLQVCIIAADLFMLPWGVTAV